MEFLERMEEFIERNRETRWDRIREMLDETFRNTRDNWWIAVRPEITNLVEFKRQFKEKYWSETAQNKVRMDIFYGKYDASNGQSPTSVSYTHLDVYKRQHFPYSIPSCFSIPFNELFHPL